MLSIVIVSYRRSDSIIATMEDLARQRTTVPFEVVLLLQAYPEGVPDAIRERFSAQLRLRVVSVPHGLGVHGARNAALEHVSGEIVAFLDDDVRLAPDWVDTLMPFYDDAGVGGVGGFVRHPGCERLASRLLRAPLGLASRRYRIDWGGFHTLPFSSHAPAVLDADWLSGCNMSFRRQALRDAGSFDEAYGRYGYDDVDMGLRVRRCGWRLVTSHKLEVQHYPSPINRPAMPDLVEEEEARRLLLVRKAIGDRPLWKARYAIRMLWHLIALGAQGMLHRTPSLPWRALRGAVRGLRLHARGQGA